MTEPDSLSIRQIVDTFGVTPRTLRFYEQKGLPHPVRIGTQRLYGKHCRTRLRLILRGKRFGFSLEEIRQWLLIYRQQGTKPQLQAWLTLADRQLADLAQRQIDLEAAVKDLLTLRDAAAVELASRPDG